MINRILTTCFFSFMMMVSFAQEWQPVPTALDDFRTDHTFGFSIDGIGYLVTGSNHMGVLMDDFMSYDPATNEWTRKDDFPGGPRGFAIGDTYNGKAYFGFGIDIAQDPQNDLWEYDPATDMWRQLADCDCPARTHPAFVINNGVIYTGMGGGGGNKKDWWAYDIATDTWSQKADFPAEARHHPYQFSIGDYVYTGFGHGNGFISDEWYRYDPATDTWDQMANIDGEARVAGTQFSHNGKGYVLSGDGSDHNSMETGEIWEYDADANSWTELDPHPGMSRWAPASFVIDNEIYIIGGWSFDVGYPDTNWKYNLGGSTNTEEEVLEDITISPNPFSDFVRIDANGQNIVSAAVADVTGKLVRQIANPTQTIDLQDLSAGVFILTLKDKEGKSFQTKIVKQ